MIHFRMVYTPLRDTYFLEDTLFSALAEPE